MRPIAIDDARARRRSRASAAAERSANDVDHDEEDDPRDGDDHANDDDDATPFARAIAVIDPFVRDQIATHPLRLLGGAALLGFALGGGLSSRIARIAALAAVRHAARPLLREVAASVVARAIPHDERSGE